ncbi:MAG: MlrC C-terminal domain-containing protein [Sandaracinaceae bacterium]|nr:MlrC C-terminal domain-containing protein [Sandaracinaceae bacterium]
MRLDIELPAGATGALHCVITEGPPLPLHPRFWRELGLDPRRADVLVQKSFFHYRIFYAALSFAHVPVTSHGATSFRRVRERSYRTPTHPAACLDDWRPLDWNAHAVRGASTAAAQRV